MRRVSRSALGACRLAPPLALAACTAVASGMPEASSAVSDATLAAHGAQGDAKETSRSSSASSRKNRSSRSGSSSTTASYALLKTYDICNWSGALGPKVKEGDRQAPEGFYTITPAQMNPNSSYYLSFNIGFPNAMTAPTAAPART